MKFSERVGARPRPLQLGSMDKSLRNKIWNYIHIYFLSEIKDAGPKASENKLEHVIPIIFDQVYSLPMDNVSDDIKEAIRQLRDEYFASEWYLVYDLIEWLTSIISIDIDDKEKTYFPFTVSIEEFIEEIETVLEEENAGYRFMDTTLVPITSERELKSIEEAIDTAIDADLDNIANHIETAVLKLSDRKNPDYRNSIKESISAVEGTVRILSESKKTGISVPLKELMGKLKIPPALQQGYSNLYGYTSGNSGIRHAMMGEEAIGHEEALYMLVSCSAFVHYLLRKGKNAGLL